MNLCLSILLVFSLVATPFALAQKEPISLTNTQGKSISVYLQKSNNTEVTVKLANNRKVTTIKLNVLDHASRQKIKEWKASGGGLSTDFEIEFDSGKTSRARENYSDDRILTLKPVVTITNDHRNIESKQATATVLVLGRPAAEPSLIHVFLREKHKLPTIEGGDDHSITLEGIRTTYDKHGYKHGNKYLGYIVIIHEGNEIISAKSIPEPLIEKHGAKLLGLKANKYYDRNLTEVKDFTRYGY